MLLFISNIINRCLSPVQHQQQQRQQLPDIELLSERRNHALDTRSGRAGPIDRMTQETSGAPARQVVEDDAAPPSLAVATATTTTTTIITTTTSSVRKSISSEPMSESDTASSRLSSPASRSPTPPADFHLVRSYPSPSASQESSQETSEQEGSPSPDCMPLKARPRSGDDAPPPAKRRRVTEPKVRMTRHLDLSTGVLQDDQQEQLASLLKVLHNRRKIVVVAGAGISVSAGIPDFRSSTGLFKTLKTEHKLKFTGRDLFDASVYRDDKSTDQFHDMVRNLSRMTKAAKPTPFHHTLATLAQQGRLLRLYTQNVDCIDTQLPPLSTAVPLNRKGPWPRSIQVHGNIEKMVCSKCHEISDLEAELFDGPEPPVCPHCLEADTLRTEHAGKRSHGVGRLRPRMVLYNEHNPDDEAIGAVMRADLLKRPDALIVVGTTLKIPGVKRMVKEMCKIVRDRRDGLTIWINYDSPPPLIDIEWDLIVKGPCDEVARRACLRKWDEPDDVAQATDKTDGSASPKVVILSPAKKRAAEFINGVLTPVSSPKISATANLKKTVVAPQTFKTLATIGASGDIVSKPIKAAKPATNNLGKPVKQGKAAGTAKPRKTTGSKKKATVIVPPGQRINMTFKAGKPSTVVGAMSEKPAKEHRSEDQEISKPARLAGLLADLENTPRKNRHENLMNECLPLLEESRVSSSPVRPPCEPISPRSGRVNSGEYGSQPVKLPSLVLKNPKTRDERHESPEERRRIVSPSGPVSPNLQFLLN